MYLQVKRKGVLQRDKDIDLLVCHQEDLRVLAVGMTRHMPLTLPASAALSRGLYKKGSLTPFVAAISAFVWGTGILLAAKLPQLYYQLFLTKNSAPSPADLHTQYSPSR